MQLVLEAGQVQSDPPLLVCFALRAKGSWTQNRLQGVAIRVPKEEESWDLVPASKLAYLYHLGFGPCKFLDTLI